MKSNLQSQSGGLLSEIPNRSGGVLGWLKNHAGIVISALVLVVIVIFGIMQFQQNQSLRAEVSRLKGETGVSDAEIKELVDKVGKLVILPDEEPTIATVTDPDKLSDQAFFSSAKTGDKVLIFTNAKKAILYRPEQNKIIEVAPVNIGESETQPNIAGDIAPVTDKNLVSIQIQNASGIDGLARRVAAKFTVAGYSLVSVSDAPGGVADSNTITYGKQFEGHLEDIKNILANPATTNIQVGATEVVIVLGRDFKE